MRILESFAVKRIDAAGPGLPVVGLSLQAPGEPPVAWALTRVEAVSLVAKLSDALEPEADAPDAGRVVAQ